MLDKRSESAKAGGVSGFAFEVEQVSAKILNRLWLRARCCLLRPHLGTRAKGDEIEMQEEGEAQEEVGLASNHSSPAP